jgi:hypothetical protein
MFGGKSAANEEREAHHEAGVDQQSGEAAAVANGANPSRHARGVMSLLDHCARRMRRCQVDESEAEKVRWVREIRRRRRA